MVSLEQNIIYPVQTKYILHVCSVWRTIKLRSSKHIVNNGDFCNGRVCVFNVRHDDTEACGAVGAQVQTPLQSACRCVPEDTSPQIAPVGIAHSIEYVSRFG